MTSLTDEPAGGVPGEEGRRLERRLRAMTITVVVLAVALIGLGAWVVYDLVAESEAAATTEVVSVLEDYKAAWNDYDSDAFLGLVANYYTFVFGAEVNTDDMQAAEIARLGQIDWHVDTIGEPIMSGTGSRYYIAVANRITSDIGDSEGISTFIVVRDGDTFKIAQHTFVGS